MNKRLRRIYCSIKQRCYNPKNISYKHYGKLGITICEEWLHSDNAYSGWNNFRRWALANGYNDNLTIDRIDNNKGYSPSNCRWVSMKVQENNRTNNHFITYKEKTQSMRDWCKELGLKYDTVEATLNQFHWSVEKAFEYKNPRQS